MDSTSVFVPKVSTEGTKKGCYLFGAQAVKKLSSSMKKEPNLFNFKTMIKHFHVERSLTNKEA